MRDFLRGNPQQKQPLKLIIDPDLVLLSGTLGKGESIQLLAVGPEVGEYCASLAFGSEPNCKRYFPGIRIQPGE
jgi:hypothetical protein